MTFRVLIALTASLSAAGCTITTAKPPTNRPSSAPTSVSISDSRAESSESVGRGRGRNGGLPPGIAKNLARGKPLPPGIARRHVPDNVLLQLPSLEEGFEYIVVAGKILLVEIATQVIHDILVDVILE